MKETELQELYKKYTDKDGNVDWAAINKAVNDATDSVSLKNSKKAEDKANAKMLADLGITSVDDYKKSQADNLLANDKNKSETDKKMELLTKQVEEQTKINKENTAKNTLLENNNSARNLGVKKDNVNDFLTIANSKVNDDTNLESAMKSTLESYPNFKEESVEKPNLGGFNFGVKSKGVPGQNSDEKIVSELATALGVTPEK